MQKKEEVKQISKPLWSVTVRMEPPHTTAQQRRWTRTGYTFLPQKVRDAAKSYRDAFETYRPDTPIDGALRVDVLFVYSTKDKQKAGRYKRTKPDNDNACKLLLDQLSSARGVGIISDDARIADLHAVKRWGEVGSVSVTISLLEE